MFNRKWIKSHTEIPFWIRNRRFILPTYVALVAIIGFGLSLILYGNHLELALGEAEQNLEKYEDSLETSKDSLDNLEEAIDILRELQFTLAGQRDSLKNNADSLETELNEANESLAGVNLQKEQAINERDQAFTDRDQAFTDRDQAFTDRNQAYTDRDQALVEADSANQRAEEADARTLTVAMSAQSQRLHEIEDDDFAAYLAVYAQKQPKDGIHPYLNDVLDALQLARNTSVHGERRASLLLSEPTRKFEIIGVAVSPDDKTIAYSDNSGSLIIKSPPYDSTFTFGKNEKVRSLAFSNDGNNLVVLLNDQHPERFQSIRGEWKKVTSDPIRSLEERATGNMVFLPNHPYLAIPSGPVIELLRTDTWKFEETPLQPPSNTATIQSIVAAGDMLIAGSNNGALFRWDNLANPRPITINAENSSLNEVDELAFSPGGDTLAIGGKGTIIDDKNNVLDVYGIWTHYFDARSDSVYSDHKGPVYSLAFSGDWLASGSADGTIRMWPRSTTYTRRDRALILKGHERWVRDVQFIQEGKQLISGSADGSVRRWILDVEQLANEICSILEDDDRLPSKEDWERLFDEDIEYPTKSKCKDQLANAQP